MTRPVAELDLQSCGDKKWITVKFVVDTGADYTVLPKSYIHVLGINPEAQCKRYKTFGIGGSEYVYILPGIRVSFGKKKFNAPIGFLNRNNIPPLLGRYGFLDKFKVELFDDMTKFSSY